MAASNHEHPLDETDIASMQAADWFARMANDRVSESECTEFRKWRSASLINAQAYDSIASAWERTASFADEPSILEMRVAALADSSDRPSWLRYAPLAAVIVLMVLATATLTMASAGWLGAGDGREGIAQIADAGSTEEVAAPAEAGAGVADEQAASPANLAFRSAYSTRIGEMAEFSLPDGSSIALNTASEVRVDFSANKRDLVLVRGEAVFTVAKDSDRPFTVAAGRNRVVALGTVFAVRKTGDEEAQVTLIEGRVRVDQGNRNEGSTSAQLVAGEQLRILPDRSFTISKAELARATSWRDGRLVFDQTPLREVLEEFNRYTNEKHVLRDQRLGGLLVNGTFRIESSEHFAATLEAGFPVSVRARSGGTILEVRAAQEFDERNAVQDN